MQANNNSIMTLFSGTSALDKELERFSFPAPKAIQLIDRSFLSEELKKAYKASYTTDARYLFSDD